MKYLQKYNEHFVHKIVDILVDKLDEFGKKSLTNIELNYLEDYLKTIDFWKNKSNNQIVFIDPLQDTKYQIELVSIKLNVQFNLINCWRQSKKNILNKISHIESNSIIYLYNNNEITKKDLNSFNKLPAQTLIIISENNDRFIKSVEYQRTHF